MFVKAFGFIVGMAGYLMLVMFGGWLVFKADRLPQGWPNWRVNVLIFHWTVKLPDSLGAQLASLKAREAAAATHSVQVTQAQGQITEKAQTDAVAAQVRIRTVTRTLIQQVPYAVPPSSDSVLSAGWVRVHDAAALGLPSVPPSAPGADAGPSGLKSSDALKTVVGNYGAANACFAQDAGLKDWIRQMEAVK